jgi:4-amino-4-deoxy-L-arabinose transferase-like glycosyltransferase
MIAPQRPGLSMGKMLEEGARLILLIFLGVTTLICLVYQMRALGYRYQLDYGEAPLVDQAARLAAGGSLYHADLSTPPYTISNYPPLYVAVLAPLVKAFGPAFWSGRLISTLAAWMSALYLFLILEAQTRDRLAALLAGLLFLAFPYVTFWSSLARIDLLALAFSLGALWVLVRWPTKRWAFWAGGLLLVAAIYTRQSYALAAPFAAFVWLWTKGGWRRAFGLALLVGGLGGALFLGLNLWTGGGFYLNIVTANVNEFKTDWLSWNVERFWNAAQIVLCLGAGSLLLVRRWNPVYAVAAPYALGAALSALTVGKIGSNVNYFLELCAALALAAGAVVAWSRGRTGAHWLRGALYLALAAQASGFIQITFREYVSELRNRYAAADDLRRLETLVAEADGPVLADEQMGMVTLAGRPLHLQPFEMTQLAWAGVWDQTPLLKRIRNKEFAYIVVYNVPWKAERWTAEMLAAVNQAYLLTDVVADNQVYRAFTPSAAVSAERCPGAAWQLPSRADLGVQWQAGALDFYGRGNESTVPVYAVADGVLWRVPGQRDAVAILHADPLRPGQQVWTYYTGMSDASGAASFIASDFLQADAGVPVRAGDRIGYQGSWSGRAYWPMWVHVRFAVVRAAAGEAFPAAVTPELLLDPRPYLNLVLSEANRSQPLECGQP